ncbi:MAG: 50S ribosomal protein L17 [Candidatus Omnitrophica bacterium]|nr:50S ribosomal protein L17 [Candidatus Omnitrophota bacterium]
MWHRRRRGRLALEPEHRLSLIRNLAKELITHQRVVTTHLRAKEAARFTEKLITIARGNNLHARRRLVAELGSGTEAVAKRLIEVVVPKFSDRKGGCTRVLHYRIRKGDNAQLALVEFSTPIEIIKKKVRKKKERKPTEVKETKEVHEKKAPKEKEEQKSEKKKEKAEEKKETPGKEAPKKGGFLSGLRKFLTGKDE